MDQSLFSHNSLKLGQIHWYILKADNEMSARLYRNVPEGSSGLHTTEWTDFGHEVGRDEIHWWVFKKEKDVEELRRQTERALDSVQNVSVKLECPIYRRGKWRSYDRRDAPIIVVRDGSKIIA